MNTRIEPSSIWIGIATVSSRSGRRSTSRRPWSRPRWSLAMLNRSAMASKGLNSLELDALALTAVPVDMTGTAPTGLARGQWGRRDAMGEEVGASAPAGLGAARAGDSEAEYCFGPPVLSEPSRGFLSC